MKIANVVVGSMETNGPKVCDWLQKRRPDIVTLQKIGSKKDFPTDKLRKTGYENEVLGRRSHSDLGVAILSHLDLPMKPEVLVCNLPGGEKAESRFLTVSIGDLWVSSIYAPFNPKGENPKQAIERRVAWQNRLQKHIDNRGYANRKSLLCGDFNVMADDPPWGKGYSQDEKDALQELLDLGFCDLYRCAHPDHKTMPGWTRGYSEECPTKGSNRLHLILASKSLKRRLRSACVDVESRPWPRKEAPPLVVELEGVRV